MREPFGDTSHEGCEAPLIADARLAGYSVGIEACAEALAQALLCLLGGLRREGNAQSRQQRPAAGPVEPRSRSIPV